jgi:hypothetical protein
MSFEELEELIRKYLSTGIAVVVLLVAPGTGTGDRALPAEPSVEVVRPGDVSAAPDRRQQPAGRTDPGPPDPEPLDSGPSEAQPDLPSRGPAELSEPDTGAGNRTGAGGTDPERADTTRGTSSGSGGGTGGGNAPGSAEDGSSNRDPSSDPSSDTAARSGDGSGSGSGDSSGSGSGSDDGNGSGDGASPSSDGDPGSADSSRPGQDSGSAHSSDGGSRPGNGSGSSSDPDFGPRSDSGSGSGSGPDSSPSSGSGSGSGPDSSPSSGSSSGSGPDSGPDSSPSSRSGSGSGSGPGSGPDSNSGSGSDSNAGSGSGPDSGTGDERGGGADSGRSQGDRSAPDDTRGDNSRDRAGTGTGTGTGSTAAERHGWGTPDRVDDFSGGADQWNIYDGPGHAGQGTRSPSAVSLQDGILTITGDSSGTTAGMAWNPGQKYGRWEGRVKAPASDPSYNALLLLWPDAENFPVGGEIDFMEMMDSERRRTDTFIHYGADNSQVNGQVQVDATEWHNWALEWTPDAITAYVDGEEWYRTTDTSIFPPGPMHLCIQLDWFPKGGTPEESVMHVDWVKQYSLDAGSDSGGGDSGGGDSGGRSRNDSGNDTSGSGRSGGRSGDSGGGSSGSGSGDATGSGGGNGDGEAAPVREAVRRMFSWR